MPPVPRGLKCCSCHKGYTSEVTEITQISTVVESLHYSNGYHTGLDDCDLMSFSVYNIIKLRTFELNL